MQRYFLHLSYKGTNFFGWQIQPNQASIQGEIEDALTQLHSGNKVSIVGCGRTDTGVHASSYYAHFDTDLEIEPTQLKFKLNSMLHKDIAILDVFAVGPEAHARFDAISRSYNYFIHFEKNPFLNELSWQLPQNLDIDKMNECCPLLINHKDFECFSKVKTDVTNFNCDITNAVWLKSDKGLIFSITANRFLRNMVRAIVGTMIEVGNGKLDKEGFQKILNSRNRSEAGKSVPAVGLFLADVKYPKEIL